MSLEAALDEEMRDVMALLEGRKTGPTEGQSGRARAASPSHIAQSPVRSMLDVGGGPRAGRHASIAGTTMAGISAPSSSHYGGPQTVRSMLNTASSSSSSPPFQPLTPTTSIGKQKPEEAYNFEMLPSIESQAMPKRVGLGGKKKVGPMASLFGAVPDVGMMPTARKNSMFGRGPESVSPGARGLPRSHSPAAGLLNNGSMLPQASPGTYVSDNGQVIDLASAYRRLSDAALLKSGGRLSNLPTRKGADIAKGEVLAPDGGVRLAKDYDEDDVIDSSEDDMGSSDEEWNGNGRRGRVRKRKGSGSVHGEDGTPIVKTLLGAAEEERKTVNYHVRSLLDPEPSVTITGPGGEKLKSRKGSVHPHTSFDAANSSGVSTPIDSDEEQRRDDLNSAQRMTLTLSPIHSTPSAHRCIRQILRGDYRKYQQEAEQGLRRQRMYLVSTDLSEEAAYALEWTIGTVLRDGDTLLAAYAVDEETGTGGESKSIAIGEGANVMKDTAAIVRTLSNQQGLVVPENGAVADAGSADSSKRDATPDVKVDKLERERYHATDEITARCVELLRRTKLQVRVVVEVFHCKSPKHMLIEVIDFLEPTLVILGSRGRSAIKGVLLGSFSNYLVTKSSVPVMVARKKLRKHSKLKRGNLRLSNMLQNPSGRRLEEANIEKPSGKFSRS